VTHASWSVGATARSLLENTPRLPIFTTYAAIALSLVLLFVALRPGRRDGGRDRWTIAFIGLAVLVVLLWRWPTFALYEQNPDESEDIAAALTLRHDPRYWSSVAGTTHGPAVSFPLLVPCLFGFIPEYGSARVVGLGMMVGSLLCLHGVLRRWFPADVARLLVVPLVFCLAFMRFWDYVAYNGEHAVVFLVSLAGLQAVRALAPQAGAGAAFTTGLLLGSVPFAKLQGVPPAAAIGALYMGSALVQGGRWRARLGAVAAGAVLPSILVLAYLWFMGLLTYFQASYLSWNFGYANHATTSAWHSMRALQPWLFDQRWNETFAPFLLASVAAGLVLAMAAAAVRRVPARASVLLVAVVVSAAATYAVFRPGYQAQHYLLMLLFPIGLLNGALWGPLLAAAGTKARVAFVLAFSALDLAAPIVRTLPQIVREATTPPPVPAAKRAAGASVIRQWVARGDGLLVWGWAEQYYVLTRTWRATRSVPRAPLEPGPLQPYFFRLLLEDFDRADPPVFVDAVGPGQFIYEDRERFGHEAYPALQERVAQRYRLVADVEGARIYVHRGRSDRRPAR
jgi:hypothetical protein